nr:MAG TPA: hypothetical protein [Caudoviricetes sp.]
MKKIQRGEGVYTYYNIVLLAKMQTMGRYPPRL